MPSSSPTVPHHSSPSIDSGLRSLLPYLIGLVVSCAAIQLVLAATGGGIGILSGVLTAVIAIGAVAYLAVFGRSLGQLRFGLLVAHALLYVSVNGSFAMHAYLRGVFGADLDPSWVGPALAMPAFWALGLLLHAFGALLGRGFEAERP